MGGECDIKSKCGMSRPKHECKHANPNSDDFDGCDLFIQDGLQNN